MENRNIKIQVLGSGCSTCEKLFKLTKQAAEELGLKIDVEYITDIQKIVEMGVMTSPVLAINQKPILAGFLPSLEKIKEIIKKYI
jgi:small redox-active disulfide protein 2